MEQNFDLIYRTSFENNSFTSSKYCTNLITNQLNELQVWEHVIIWGLAQNRGLPSDIENYSKDDFNEISEPGIGSSIRPKNIDSTIIIFQHVELISKWIDRLENTDKI
ncbi:BTB/POZ protein [Rhizophagus irregularis DAOM 181602=DAOM 197198]|uniref:Uncharacterized protein n=3 Tax=Rhizophagus irregularis TaxID=588596 RepID=U9T1C5_RHIID|nr:hypothetical protein GLOIN_2v1791102 [Rhizophagus irregularis DAOM 181602=DAOM 197198]EXX51026.1 hypothetical protein RirG_265310 [Rhizophagus irregularis DAOM 197198w]POG57923.1 hypothetical protein GLOIN_2v1791102 [Rhizophagus irregularis DAOM 181602=DAOM 197198]GBC39140.1 BTB/POZ protein [Rhizophagus irregularis DAOM 181602=DAOM 197198]|eukprot:XP_025164789.1 hypothetical protein GLOIN_2v1791102 [Rhizophagus irregularis DAOM 181602=DAOM 197198]